MHSSASGSQRSVGQEVVTGAGQAAAWPSQLLAEVSTEPSVLHEAGEQTTPVPAKPSAGHDAELPVHFSATSHVPADGRQTVVDAAKPSAGHDAELPVQLSATSHVPADGRQTVVDEAKPSAGHD